MAKTKQATHHADRRQDTGSGGLLAHAAADGERDSRMCAPKPSKFDKGEQAGNCREMFGEDGKKKITDSLRQQLNSRRRQESPCHHGRNGKASRGDTSQCRPSSTCLHLRLRVW